MAKHQLLDKILWKNRPRLQLAMGGFAFILGFTVLITAWQLFIDVTTYFNSQTKESNYLILNKKVSLANTILMDEATFTEEEVQEIKKQKFISDAAPFKAATFKSNIYAEAGFNLYTLMFFEAIPSKFIDEVPPGWENWRPEEQSIPIIVSRDFLNLYNFGFAPSQGLPQLSESSFKMVSLKLKLKGQGKEEVMDIKVAGFSNRISSVLVPMSFIEWANARYGNGEEKRPGRLIIEVEEKNDRELATFLEERGYLTTDEMQKTKSRAKLATTAFAISGGLGLFFLGLAFLLFALILRLAIAESKREISLLYEIGYFPKTISSLLLGKYLVWLGVMTSIAVIIVAVLVFLLKSKLPLLGIEFSYWVHYSTPLIAIIILGAAVAVTHRLIGRQIEKAIT